MENVCDICGTGGTDYRCCKTCDYDLCRHCWLLGNPSDKVFAILRRILRVATVICRHTVFPSFGDGLEDSDAEDDEGDEEEEDGGMTEEDRGSDLDDFVDVDPEVNNCGLQQECNSVQHVTPLALQAHVAM